MIRSIPFYIECKKAEKENNKRNIQRAKQQKKRQRIYLYLFIFNSVSFTYFVCCCCCYYYIIFFFSCTQYIWYSLNVAITLTLICAHLSLLVVIFLLLLFFSIVCFFFTFLYFSRISVMNRFEL